MSQTNTRPNISPQTPPQFPYGSLQGETVWCNGAEQAVKFAAVAGLAAAATDVVAAVTGKRIKVVALFLVCGGAAGPGTFKFNDSSSDLTGVMETIRDVPINLPFNPFGYFETASGLKLQITMAVASWTGNGFLAYIEY